MRILMKVADMQNIYNRNAPNNRNAPKKPTNVSINSDLLTKARVLKINLSAALESALETQVRLSAREQWLTENKKAITSLNELAENKGLFSDSYRNL